MDFKFDPPVHENTPQFSSWVARQFDRIQSTFNNSQEERKGIAAVTGSLSVPTGLKRVQYCIAGFSNDPNPQAQLLSCRVDSTAGNILIRVFSGGGTWNHAGLIATSFPLSTVSINVAWFAYGFT